MGFRLVIYFITHLQSRITSNYSAAQITLTHTGLLSLLQLTSIFAWLVFQQGLFLTTLRLVNSCWPSPKTVILGPESYGIHDLILLSDKTLANSRLKSKSKLCYKRRSFGQSILVPSTHLGPKTRFLLLSDSSGLLMWSALFDERTSLSFTSAAEPRQRSHSRVRVPRDSWPYFTLSDSGLPQPGGPYPLIYIPQEHGDPIKPPGTEFPDWLTDCKIAAGLSLHSDFWFWVPRDLWSYFIVWRLWEPRAHSHWVPRIKVKVTLRLAVYCQSFRLGAKPLEDHEQNSFFQLNPCRHSPYVTFCVTIGWVCLSWMCVALSNVYNVHQHVIENSSFALYTSSQAAP
jgi:hypothetical protein